MDSQDKPSKLAQRTYRFAWQDGLLEIFGGLMLMMTVIFMERPYTVALAYMFAFVVGPKLLERIKRKTTYPRIGYVAMKKTKRGGFDWTGLVFILSMIVLYVVVVLLTGDPSDRAQWMRWTPTLMAAILLGMFIHLVTVSGQKYYYVLATIALTGAIILAFFDFDYRYAWMIIFSVGLGGMFFLTGLIKLIVFINKYPKVHREPEVGNENA